MKKIIIVLSCALVLLSCEKRVKSSQTIHQRIINDTEKEWYYEVQTEDETQGMFLSGSDSIEMTFYREKHINIPVYPSTIHLKPIIVEKESMFNLTDTCCYIYSFKYVDLPYFGETMADSVFVRQNFFDTVEGSTDLNSIIIVTKHLTDSIVDVMQKDYSMLDRFKDYYGR